MKNRSRGYNAKKGIKEYITNLVDQPPMIEEYVLDACEEFFTVHANNFLEMEKLADKETRKFGLFSKIDYDKCIANMANVGITVSESTEELANFLRQARSMGPRIIWDENDPYRDVICKIDFNFNMDDRVEEFENSVLNIYLGLLHLIESQITEYQMLKARAEKNNRIPFSKYSEQLKLTQKIRDELDSNMKKVSAIYLPIRKKRNKNIDISQSSKYVKEQTQIKEYIDKVLIRQGGKSDKLIIQTQLVTNYTQHIVDNDASKLLLNSQYEHLKELVTQDYYRMIIKIIARELSEQKEIRERIISNKELIEYDQRVTVSLSEYLELLYQYTCNQCDKEMCQQFQNKIDSTIDEVIREYGIVNIGCPPMDSILKKAEEERINKGIHYVSLSIETKNKLWKKAWEEVKNTYHRNDRNLSMCVYGTLRNKEMENTYKQNLVDKIMGMTHEEIKEYLKEHNCEV